MTNNHHFSFCTDDTIAKYTPFKKDNIIKRYKEVSTKLFLYNAMQLNAYIEENGITEEQIKIAFDSIIGAKREIHKKIMENL